MIPLGVLAGSRHVAPSGGGGGVYFADDFNRADGDMGPDWESGGNLGTAFSIDGGRAKVSGGNSNARALTPAGSDDYYVQATIGAGSSTLSRGVIARSTGLAHYLWRFNGSTCALFYTPNNSTYTQIGDTYSAALTQPLVLRLEVEGTTLRGYVDGVLRVSGTHSGIPTTVRHAGLRSAGSGTFYADDFEIGAL